MEQHMVDGAIFVARQNSSNVLDITDYLYYSCYRILTFDVHYNVCIKEDEEEKRDYFCFVYTH